MDSKLFSLKAMLIAAACVFLFTQLPANLSGAEEKSEFPLMKVGEKYTATDKYRIWTWEVKKVKEDKSFVIDEQLEDSQDIEKIDVDKNYFVSSNGKLRNVTLNFPLFAGKKWSDSFIDQSPQYTNMSFRYDAKYEVTEYKLFKFPAGQLKAYKISVSITNKDSFRAVHNYETYNGELWYSPDLKMIVKANLAPYASYTITAYSPAPDGGTLPAAKEEKEMPVIAKKQEAPPTAASAAADKNWMYEYGIGTEGLSKANIKQPSPEVPENLSWLSGIWCGRWPLGRFGTGSGSQWVTDADECIAFEEIFSDSADIAVFSREGKAYKLNRYRAKLKDKDVLYFEKERVDGHISEHYINLKQFKEKQIGVEQFWDKNALGAEKHIKTVYNKMPFDSGLLRVVSPKKQDEPKAASPMKPKQELAPEIVTQEEQKPLPPKLSFKASLQDQNNNRILDGGETVILSVELENKGEGTASNVSIILAGNQTLLSHFGDKRDVGHIRPGEKKTAHFKAFLPNNIPETVVDLKVEVKESKGYSPLNSQVFKAAMRPARVTETVVEMSDIDVDEVPPKGPEKNDNYAVVIGIGRYRDKSIPVVRYARRDAEMMAAYLENVAGLSKANIKLLTDDGATKSDLEEQMEIWLKRRARPSSTVFVYYAGHGAPDVEGKEAYIVPYEGHPDSSYKLYPLKSMYESLNKLPTKNIVVMLDSCFSGAEGRSVTKEGARPLVISMQAAALNVGKVLVLAASEGSQISSDYEKGKHGLFTYYLLRGMRGEADMDRNGTVDMSELYDYVKRNVTEKASIELNRDQTPVLLPSVDAADTRLKIPVVKFGNK